MSKKSHSQTNHSLERKAVIKKKEEQIINGMLINISIAIASLIMIAYLYQGMRANAIFSRVIFLVFAGVFGAAAIGFVVWGIIQKNKFKRLLKYIIYFAVAALFLLSFAFTAPLSTLFKMHDLPKPFRWDTQESMLVAVVVCVLDIIFMIAYSSYNVYYKIRKRK